MLKNKSAFSLVELVVVATILVILGGIWTVGFTSYLEWVRDANRITQLWAIYDGLVELSMKGSVPRPDDYLEITTNSGVIAYQWYAGKNILQAIELSGVGKDPKTAEYYTLYMTKNKKYFQLLAHLENKDSFMAKSPSIQVFAWEHSDKTPYIYGNSLWILLGTGTDLYTPIQKLLSGSLNVETTTDSYIAYLSTENMLLGDSSRLKLLGYAAKQWWKFARNCEWILIKKSWFEWQDGYYLVDPTGNSPMEVYCDMSTEGGGWTRVYHSDSDIVARTEIDDSDWNSWASTNYSLLWSFRDSENQDGLYEFLIRNNYGDSHRFTQTNRYLEDPYANGYTKISWNFEYHGNNGTPETKWEWLGLWNFWNSSMNTNCALANGYEGSSRWNCVQDFVPWDGTGPWFRQSSIDNWDPVWIEIYQK